ISPSWLPNFSTGINPIQCHSHNDYAQKIPLYQSLAVGCVSTEVDIFVRGKDLLVGHDGGRLNSAWTLRSLYLDPLKAILEGQNGNSENVAAGVVKGIFDETPQTSFILLVDFKDSAGKTWNLFLSQLDDFRQKDWLTYWKPETGVVQRPITVVVTGASLLNDVIANTTYRDVFFDAPLGDLANSNGKYDNTNSYYASTAMGRAVGGVGQQFSAGQNSVIVAQVQQATALGLKTRYWDAPGSPEVLRNKVWENLVGLGVSVLNVDDL
ncbi:uncharacterized protein LY89DRAFT_539235, partial [Mollisia scopiformis]